MKSHLSDEMTQNSESLRGIMRSGNAENDESGDWTNPRPGNNFVKKSASRYFVGSFSSILRDLDM